MPQEEVLKTKNLKHASFLRIIPGIKFTGVEKSGRDAVFCFTPKDKAQETMNQYFLDGLTVSPKALFESFDSLKDLIFYQQAQERQEEPNSVETVQPRVTGGRGGVREY